MFSGDDAISESEAEILAWGLPEDHGVTKGGVWSRSTPTQRNLVSVESPFVQSICSIAGFYAKRQQAAGSTSGKKRVQNCFEDRRDKWGRGVEGQASEDRCRKSRGVLFWPTAVLPRTSNGATPCIGVRRRCTKRSVHRLGLRGYRPTEEPACSLARPQ